uniref:Uncharacterized protein n=1 Tax=Geospiza parvula TaxID=87175 RepID=A0A8C3Q973_GEOPR
SCINFPPGQGCGHSQGRDVGTAPAQGCGQGRDVGTAPAQGCGHSPSAGMWAQPGQGCGHSQDRDVGTAPAQGCGHTRHGVCHCDQFCSICILQFIVPFQL